MAEMKKSAKNPPSEVAEAPAKLDESSMTVTKEEEDQKKQLKGSERAMKMKHMISGGVSLASFLLSLPLLAAAIWLIYMGPYDCEAVLNLPALQIGISLTLLAVFLISNLALIFLKTRIPLAALILAVVPLFVMSIVGLGFAGAYQMESSNIAASPMWLRKKINDNTKWAQLKSCIYHTQACQSYDFNHDLPPPMQLEGCCRPPKSCEMEAVNATYWEKQQQQQLEVMSPPEDDDDDDDDGDCERWTNEPTVLCYDCDSCKTGIVRTFESKWSSLGVFLVIISLLLIVSHISVFLATTLEDHLLLVL